MPRIDQRTRPWWTLAGACFGLFILMLDSTVVALAISSIRDDVGADSAQLQWVMNGYLLTIAVLVVTAGRIGDMFGRKRVFVVGMALFAAGSVLSGASQDPQMLIGGRVLQGVGAAPILPLSLAIVCNAFPKAEQPRALGIWAGVSAVALAVGPLVGGSLIEIDWRLIFWINLPIIALGVALVLVAAPESTDPGAGTRIDLPGLIALTIGLGAVVLAMIQVEAWSDGAVVALGAVGALALLAFWGIERRVREPIVEFELFRNGPYFGASAVAFCLVAAYWTAMFFQPQYLQDVRGYSALESGLLILPVTAPMVFISPFCGQMVAAVGSRVLMTAGMAFATAGLVLLTQLEPGTSYGFLLVAYLLFGISLGLVYAPMSTAAMAAMPREKVGIASGVLAMDRIVSGAVGLAATGALFHVLRGGGDGFTAAIASSTWILAALAALGVVFAWAFVRDPSDGPRNRHAASSVGHHRVTHF